MTYSIGPVVSALNNIRSPLQGYVKRAPADASEMVEESAMGLRRLASRGTQVFIQREGGDAKKTIIPATHSKEKT